MQEKVIVNDIDLSLENMPEVSTKYFQYECFAKRLRRLRLDKDLKCSDVAQGTGLSHTAILGYEDGSQLPKMDSLIKLADFFDVSIDYLTGRTDLRRLPNDVDIIALENKLLDIGSFAEQFRRDISRRDEE